LALWLVENELPLVVYVYFVNASHGIGTSPEPSYFRKK
jgi:hypothetical protein